eukprot:TRINITY_DN7150_c0_g1_i1.p1 TRINITY_DN7150_c0_g1~~TRINITY_DN7150_c0_g1_i1.p1  ORF type:complete len:144 (+),score=6.45 TRINITY_DN7150_c0_g1_i1:3-434(+)
MTLHRTIIGLILVSLCRLTHADGPKKRIKSLAIGVLKRADDCGIKTKPNDALAVHYTGYLHASDTEFDSSIPRGDPFIFTLGVGQVIQGWEKGLLGMCIGDKRKLSVPAELAYGANGAPPRVPADADLTFVIELLNIERRDEL